MRRTIAIEGVVKVPHQLLEPGSIKFVPSGQYPVCKDSNWDEPPLGWATDIRREADGRITADLQDTIEIPENTAVTIFADAVQGDYDKPKEDPEAVFIVTEGRLRAMFFDSPGYW